MSTTPDAWAAERDRLIDNFAAQVECALLWEHSGMSVTKERDTARAALIAHLDTRPAGDAVPVAMPGLDEIPAAIVKILREPDVLRAPDGEFDDGAAAKWAFFAHGADTGLVPYYSIHTVRALLAKPTSGEKQ